MDILENLENLPVSEECFDDIIDIIEELLSEDIKTAISKKYGQPKYSEVDGEYSKKAPHLYLAKPLNKSAKLTNNVKEIQRREEEDTERREKELHPEVKAGEYGRNYIVRDENKNIKGEKKTENRRFEDIGDGWFIHKGSKKGYSHNNFFKKTDKQAIGASIERHKKKD